MEFATPCPFDEAFLLDYLHGHLDAHHRSAVESSSACIEALRRLQQETAALAPLLAAAACPPAAALVAYHREELPPPARQRLACHLQTCDLCAAELQLLALGDDLWLAELPELAELPARFGAAPDPHPGGQHADRAPGEHPLHKVLRTLREAFLIPPTRHLSPVLGEMWTYATPQLLIDLAPSLAESEELHWTLGGTLRTPGGELVAEIEQVTLTPHAGGDPTTALLTGPGEFLFPRLAAGKYRLQVTTPNEEVFIRELAIGYGV
jgi:hypothetical protein